MKFTVVFKTPDAIDYALQATDLEEDSEEYQQARKLAEKYIQYGELVHVEFDTETETATVLKL